RCTHPWYTVIDALSLHDALPICQKPLREAEHAKRFEQRFVAADLNGDGKLGKVEVAEKMPRLAKGFAWMDDDRDGFLSRAELRRSEEHTSELQSRENLVCRLLLE